MSLEACLKTSFEGVQGVSTLKIHDVKSILFHNAKPLIKQHEGKTSYRHRLVLLSTKEEGFMCGLESYEYVLSKEKEKDRHIVYISKVDTTTTKIKGLTGRLVQAYISSLPSSASVFVFARAQPQYLFAKSAENKAKVILDDRDLVSWWLSVLNKVPNQCKGWWSVPGIDDEFSALIEIGARKREWKSSKNIEWKYGHSFTPEDEAQLVIPRFDDDAKARLLKTLSGDEDSINVSEFWQLLAYGEECGSGKVTGFFELRLSAKSDHVEVEEENSDLKTSDFTKLWNKFMSLDFSTDQNNIKSTEIAKNDIKDIFPNLKSIEITVKSTSISAKNHNEDKRPAINTLSSGFIKRKKV